MEERRRIERVKYDAKSVIVDRETTEKIYADVINLSPLGIAVRVPAGTKDLLDKDVIIVAETLIMYADVTRVEDEPSGTKILGLKARKFTNEVLQYLFDKIADDENN